MTREEAAADVAAKLRDIWGLDLQVGIAEDSIDDLVEDILDVLEIR